MLKALPVIPPDLRPLVPLMGSVCDLGFESIYIVELLTETIG